MCTHRSNSFASRSLSSGLVPLLVSVVVILLSFPSEYNSCQAFTLSTSPLSLVASQPASPLSIRTKQQSAFAQPTKIRSNKRSSSRYDNRLQMSTLSAAPKVTAGVAALAGVVTGGLFAGGLHAVAGPDHLAALLPRCCGQRWYRAGRIGALWGMGHGISATLLGALAFGLKSRLNNLTGITSILSGASHLLEVAVGASLVFIGLLGIKEAREWENEIQPQSLSAAAVDTAATKPSPGKRAVIFNGLLHGFSWDGAPSLAPALAVSTWRGNISFLLAYALGTMGTMALTTTLVGEGTRRAGEIFHRPDIPQKLSLVSSCVAIAVGVAWVGFALV